MKHLLYASAVVGVWLGCAACTTNKEPAFKVSFDFEQFTQWIAPSSPLLTTEQARSGKNSFRMEPGAEYGTIYSTTLKDAGSIVPRELHLSGWVYLPSGRIRATGLVVSINCQGRRPDVWEALSIDQTVKRYQVWTPIRKYIHLPDDLLPSDELKLYMWHNEPNGELLFLDDLKLEGWQ